MIGKTGTLKFRNGSTAKVRIVTIDTYKCIQSGDDYWLEYVEGETNKLLVHPEYGKSPVIKSEILLPEGMVLNNEIIEFD